MTALATTAGKILLDAGRRYLLRHTFSGGALTPSDQGPPFTTLLGTAVVSGGVLAKADATGLHVQAAGPGPNMVLQAKVNYGTSGGGGSQGIYLKARFPDAANAYEVQWLKSGYLAISKRVASVDTALGTTSVVAAGSTDYWLRFSVVGDRLEVLTSTDGAVFTSRLVVTDSTFPAGVGVGLRLFDNVASPTVAADDFMVWSA